MAFVLDPDGYAIEVVRQKHPMETQPVDCCGFEAAEGGEVGVLPPAVVPPPYATEGPGGALLDAGRYYASVPHEDTAAYVMQQTMVRIKDPKVSLPFYTDVLGMTLVQPLHFSQWGFSLYFVAYLPSGVSAAGLPGAEGSRERMEFLWALPATVELTHNHGSEASEGTVYHAGNNYDGINEGFGHLGITVRCCAGQAFA